MVITVTSRHFKAHTTLIEYAEASVQRLEKFYDGLVKCEVILSFEKSQNSLKHALVNVHVHKNTLSAEGKSEDFQKSIDESITKLEHQLVKYKERIREKDRLKVRAVKEKI